MLAAARLHGDDTTVPVLAKGKTVTGRGGSIFAMTDRLPARTHRGVGLLLAQPQR